MFKIILFIFKIIFLPFSKIKKELIAEFLLVMKENTLLRRKLESSGKKIRFTGLDKLFYAIISKLAAKFKSLVTLVKPETVLKWYHNFMKKRWDYSVKNKGGRPQTSTDIKELILKLKNENIVWGNKKIQGELLKLGIDLDKNTIAKIIREFRKKGRVKNSGSWKKFIMSHIESLFAMDFLTVESIFSGRLYIFFIICLKTREIVQFGVTDSPSKCFVTQQLFAWREDKEREKVYLIHDNALAFSTVNYDACNVRSVPTSPYAPNMNAIAERFVRSIRNEALDHFILFNYNQVEGIVRKYMTYYNQQRPHQGIEQQTPLGYTPQKEGEIISFPVLSGLHHHYSRKAS